MNFNIIVDKNNNEEFEDFIHKKLREYNDSNSPMHREYRKPGMVKNINIIAEGKDGEWIGGPFMKSTDTKWLVLWRIIRREAVITG